MKTNIIILINLILFTLFFSCRDSGPDDPNPPMPKDSCVVFEPILDAFSKVNVYSIFDSIQDIGHATRVNVTSFFNLGLLIIEKKIAIYLLSKDQNGRTSDEIIFYLDKNAIGCYNILYDLRDPNIGTLLGAGASFASNDDDTIIDSYLLDTSRSDNKIEIVSVDTVQKIMEGRFACSFVFANDRPKRDPLNLDTMRFFNGYFKGKYVER